MAHYAIGDVQGCYAELAALLAQIGFNHGTDTLWLAGDLVNRGPQSLASLQFAMQHESSVQMVLGNHDLHLLAMCYGQSRPKPKDTLDDILTHPAVGQMRDWLRRRPLLHDNGSHLLVHAGILPEWSTAQALELAAEVEAELRGRHPKRFFEHMYGDKPAAWSPKLKGRERLRFVTNIFTRMRALNRKGEPDYRFKSAYETLPPELHAWFDSPGRRCRDRTIVFGHWSALGYRSGGGILALDTGAVWGGVLTAVDLDSGQVYRQPALDDTRTCG